ncbi:MAG: PH domain-containing protein [Haloechinothrix sp.]
MDNSVHSWGPSTAVLVACGAACIGAAAGSVWFAIGGDFVGATLTGILAVALAALTLHAVRLRPRLAADRQGILIRTLAGPARTPWARVHARVVRTRRLGRDVETLELELDTEAAEGDPRLIVLGRFELGADPRDVLEQLQRVRAG